MKSLKLVSFFGDSILNITHIPAFFDFRLSLQGKVEMWIDMFAMDMPSPGAPVDITPRKPAM